MTVQCSGEEMDNIDKRDTDARSILQITYEDIKVAKNRLWTSTYYILSLYAGLIAFSKYLDLRPTDDWIKFILLIFGGIITVYAFYHLIETHSSIVRYRRRLMLLTDMMHKEVKEIYQDIPKYHNFNRYFFSLTFPFILLIIWAYLLLIVSLFKAAIINLVWFLLPLALIIDSAVAIYVYFKE
jgi:hypothetical protein